jgi:hypothetical protein
MQSRSLLCHFISNINVSRISFSNMIFVQSCNSKVTSMIHGKLEARESQSMYLMDIPYVYLLNSVFRQR